MGRGKELLPPLPDKRSAHAGPAPVRGDRGGRWQGRRAAPEEATRRRASSAGLPRHLRARAAGGTRGVQA
eukprot:15464242-Alexandrium_andersonii.AAC.1